MRASDSDLSVRVWDPFVRVFHWSLVSCVVLNFFVVDDGETLHQFIGYLAAGLVAARFVWGADADHRERDGPWRASPGIPERVHRFQSPARAPTSPFGPGVFGPAAPSALQGRVFCRVRRAVGKGG